MFARLISSGGVMSVALLLTLAACDGDSGPVPTGSLVVSTVSGGEDVDPDGYEVSVDLIHERDIQANGSVTFTDLASGEHGVALKGIASNCALADNPRVVTVPAGGEEQTTFSVNCEALTSLTITAITTGETLDPNGYLLVLDRADTLSLGIDESQTLSGLEAGDHILELADLAPNCRLEGDNPRTLSIRKGEKLSLEFAVDCEFALRDQIVFSSDRDGNLELYVMDSDGSNVRRLTNNPANDDWPTVSPDGTRIAFASDREFQFDIYVINSDGSGLPVNITNSDGEDIVPSWSPVGSQIAFSSSREGNREIYVVDSDGTGLQRLTFGPESDTSPSWSQDGERIVFVSGSDMHIINRDGSRRIEVIDETGTTHTPAWSPHGNQIAYTTLRFAGVNLALTNPDGTAVARLTSDDRFFDLSASWSPDATRIVFEREPNPALLPAGDSEIFVINVDGTGVVNLTGNKNPGRDENPVWSPLQ